MNRYTQFTHGTTGIVLHVLLEDGEVQDVRIDDEDTPVGPNILDLLSDDILIDIELEFDL